MTKSLPKLPSLPKSRQLNRCECGCNGLTGNRFVPGHDAKLAAWVKRVKAGVFAKETPGDAVAQLDAATDYLSVAQVEATAQAGGWDWSEDSWLERVDAAEKKAEEVA